MAENNRQEMWEKYRNKYADISVEKISEFYYGSGNAMQRVLYEIKRGIIAAANIYQTMKMDDEAPIVEIFFDEDEAEILFSIADRLFYTHNAGERMVEALVLMSLMDESGISTPIDQALCNWADDTEVEGLGQYVIADRWAMMEGYEGSGSDWCDYPEVEDEFPFPIEVEEKDRDSFTITDEAIRSMDRAELAEFYYQKTNKILIPLIGDLLFEAIEDYDEDEPETNEILIIADPNENELVFLYGDGEGTVDIDDDKVFFHESLNAIKPCYKMLVYLSQQDRDRFNLDDEISRWISSAVHDNTFALADYDLCVYAGYQYQKSMQKPIFETSDQTDDETDWEESAFDKQTVEIEVDYPIGIKFEKQENPELIFFILDQLIKYCPASSNAVELVKTLQNERDTFTTNNVMQIGNEIYVTLAKEDQRQASGYDCVTVSTICSVNQISFARNQSIKSYKITNEFCAFITDLLLHF